jgi:hypothetical protein
MNMMTPELFWSWAIAAAIILPLLGISIFAIAYVPYAIWKNRRRK